MSVAAQTRGDSSLGGVEPVWSRIVRRLCAALDSMCARPSHLIGASLFRVVLGTAFLYQLAVLVAQHELLFAPDGVFPFDRFVAEFGVRHVSLFACSGARTWQMLAFGLSLAVIFAWTVGLGGRLGTLAMWWVVHSVHTRTPGLWDGGDNLAEILLIYAVGLKLFGARSGDSRLAYALHRCARLACVLQVCTVYLGAGLAKVPGKYWQNGTAFYYVLQSEEFGVTSIGHYIWANKLLLALCTWAPLMLQLAFPWILLFGRSTARRVVVVMAISFHLGIFFLMGLSTFAAVMIAAELLLLSDDDYRAFSRGWRSLVERLWTKRKKEGQEVNRAL